MYSIGFWNVRGLNDLNKQKVVKWFLHNNEVGLFGLLETKLKPGTLLNKNTSICDGWRISTNCSWHKGGRIWVLWKPNCFEINFISYSAQHIHMIVTSRADNKTFKLTMIYAFNGLEERVALWNTLKEISFDCALFTLSNKQNPADRVYSRLDRAMGNQAWLEDFGDNYAYFHPEGLFDHCPCTVLTTHSTFGGRKNFKYFNMWGSASQFKNIVENKTKTTIATKALENIQKKLVENPGDIVLLQREMDMAHDLKELISTRDSFFIQKAKVQWDAWEIIGDEICDAVQNFFDTGKLLTQLNATIITLIPKVERPETVKHYRPISCCNVIYKTISKLLCARLAVILPDIISRNQGAFVKGRSILENILICQDLIRLCNRGMASPRCMFKMDLQKAYDTIEWKFVDQMLSALNFPYKFHQLIMACLTSPTYTLNLNGAHFGYFPGKRGLRQGDPISPLLFCICMEYLSRIMLYL
ncbi:uncharacterized protein LOC141607456 [Silene latifolia]|uniref:uncharacterized protein LOC141607456 n=1 Tax=Silene latifolia TaxID=37657 RepID=UPI003D77D153